MRLKEFEIKKLLMEDGFPVPDSILVSCKEDIENMPFEEGMVKIQTYRGGRGKRGGILSCKNKKDLQDATIKVLHASFEEETIHEVLIEQKVDTKEEYYVGFIFDTRTRGPMLILSKEGGIDIEKTLETKDCVEIDIREGLKKEQVFAHILSFPEEIREKLAELVMKLWTFFCKYDFRMLEFNPVIQDKQDVLFIADALGEIDENALFRQDLPFKERIGLRKQTERERLAREIDKEDHNGVCGRTFIELNGDIAVLASGGGASLTAMDALLSYGGNPANYTEYSGNPPAEKVEKLTKITLSKPGLNGCFVVGGTANFTRIDITIKGFIDGLKEISPKYPIVIRRAGPGDKEAIEIIQEAIKEYGFDIHFFDEKTPITKSAQIMVGLVQRYKEYDNIN